MQKTNTYSKLIPDYKSFNALPDSDQMECLIILEKGFGKGEAIKVKNLINAVYYGFTNNFYYKKKCLGIYVYGIFHSFFPPEGLIEKISDLTDDENPFVLEFAIKCLYRLHLFITNEVDNWLQTMIFHKDAEVRAEAYHCRARLHFYKGLASQDMQIYICSLIDAIKDCENAIAEIANRTDANMLLKIAIGLKVICLNQSSKEYSTAIASAELSLRKFVNFNGGTDEIIYFLNILNTMSAIRRISLSNPSAWLEIKKELINLLVNIQQIDVAYISDNPMQNELLQAQMFALREGLVKTILIPKFGYDLYRLKRLEEEGLIETEQQASLLKNIIAWIEDSNKMSDNSKDINLEVFIKFHDAFPEIDTGKLKERLDSVRFDNAGKLLDLFLEMTTEKTQKENFPITTGIPTGDEILQILIASLRNLLPGYNNEKFIELCLVIRDVINYLINAIRGSKAQFGFLFESVAKEIQLQESMMVYLKASDRSSKYIPEVREFVDGGRVDIIYKSDMLELPIELKRSFETITWDRVTTDYLAQAQTYANTRDQIAIFITLDLSEQKASRPETNVRNLFKILNLEGRQDVPVNHADHVIAFILPGNKLLPSQRAIYR